MRLWSLHPGHLDRKRLVAVWREGLLAQAVLQGNTRGYRNHPQINRFREHSAPMQAIGAYLLGVWQEACYRGYRFDETRIVCHHRFPEAFVYNTRVGERCQILLSRHGLIPVSETQLRFEYAHLAGKTGMTLPENFCEGNGPRPWVHPLFFVIPGPKAEWERG